MPKYNVHLYAIVRVTFPMIEADSHQEAADKAADQFTPADLSRGVYAEEIPSAVVDVVGDHEHRLTKGIEFH